VLDHAARIVGDRKMSRLRKTCSFQRVTTASTSARKDLVVGRLLGASLDVEPVFPDDDLIADDFEHLARSQELVAPVIENDGNF